jgi:hypothetical protein
MCFVLQRYKVPLWKFLKQLSKLSEFDILSPVDLRNLHSFAVQLMLFSSDWIFPPYALQVTKRW